jgi:hypothetical protein
VRTAPRPIEIEGKTAVAQASWLSAKMNDETTADAHMAARVFRSRRALTAGEYKPVIKKVETRPGVAPLERLRNRFAAAGFAGRPPLPVSRRCSSIAASS